MLKQRAGIKMTHINYNDKLPVDIQGVINSEEFAEKTRHLGIFPLGNTPQ